MYNIPKKTFKSLKPQSLALNVNETVFQKP